MAFNLRIDYRAQKEIDFALGYLVEKNKSAAKKLLSKIESSFKLLSKNPYNQLRYNEIRCLPLKGFPFMFHYSVDEKTKTVNVHGFIHTSQDPNKYWINT
jgi:toxin ParE1/3/4